MKRMLACAAIMAIAGLPMGPAAPAAETLRQQSEKSFDAAGLKSVKIENTRGLVRVTADGAGAVHLTAVKESRGTSRERAERLARETRVTAEVRDGVLEVRVVYPRHQHLDLNFWDMLFGHYEVPRFQVRLGLEIPAGLAVEVRTTSGDIMTDGIRGAQALSSTSGDVTFLKAAGTVRASTTSGNVEGTETVRARLSSVSGDIHVNQARGPISANSASGDVTVRGAADTLVLETASGDIGVTDAPKGATVSATSGTIVVRGAAGVVHAKSSSGDIGLRLVDPLRRVEVSTTSGDITTRYLSSAGCTLDLSTATGTIDVFLPVELRTATRRALRGKVGDGSVPLHLTTASGDIVVRGPRN